MWLDKSVMFPTLHSTIRQVIASTPNTIVQFVLEPLAFPLILADFTSHGEQFSHQLSFLTRTFAFYMHKQYKKNLEAYNDQTNTRTNPVHFSASDDRDLVLSDQMLPTSCTSQSSCTVEPHTTSIFTHHDRTVSVRCARNVTRHAHSLCYRENLQCQLNQSTNIDHHDVRDLPSNCGQVCGGGGGERASIGHDRSLHNAFSTKITINLDNGHL